MAKGKTLTGKTVTIEVITSKRRDPAKGIKYVTTDGSGNRKVHTGEAALHIHRKTL